MVRYRYADSVLMQVSGPKSILPEPITRTGRLGMTWLHFLNGTCGLQLDADSDYFICTSTYTVASPEMGWTADLNAPIKPFIDKFSRKRSKYCVRLHTGSEPEGNTSSTDPVDNGNTTDNATVSTWLPSILRKPTPTSTAPVRKFASSVPLTPAQVTASAQTLKRTGTVYERPTPAIVIPTRGPQLITPILPPQQTQSGSRAPPTTSSHKNQQASTSPRKRAVAKTSQNEVSMRVGAGKANGTGSSQNSAGASESESSPPKLTRFDATEQARVSRTANGSSNIAASNTEPQPSTSKAAASSSAAAATTSQRPHRQKNAKKSTRRYEEDSFPKIMNFAGGALKIEPIEINLEEVNQADGVGQNQSEEEIFNTLGIQDDDDEDLDDSLSMCTAASAEERDLRLLNIPFQDLKNLLEGKLDRFDNSMLNRIQSEIRRLKKNKLWDRNVKRSPLACYLLSVLFDA